MSREDEIAVLDAILSKYPDVLTVHHVSEIIGRKVPTVYKWLQEGEIPGSQLSGSWIIYRDAVRSRLIERMTERHET